MEKSDCETLQCGEELTAGIDGKSFSKISAPLGGAGMPACWFLEWDISDPRRMLREANLRAKGRGGRGHKLTAGEVNGNMQEGLF
jgi:hypothetical protein